MTPPNRRPADLDSTRKPSILCFVGTYLPGYKAGGPTRSVANLVARLSDDFEFRIITADRDLGDSTPYSGVVTREWVEVGKAKVWYESNQLTSASKIWSVFRSQRYSLIYVNSFFSPKWSMLPQTFRRLGASDVPLLIAPRGEFSAGALELKSRKKRAYLSLFRAVSLQHRAFWQASSDYEAQDIIAALGVDQARVHVASGLTAALSKSTTISDGHNPVGHVAVCFVSRISPMKNLLFAAEVLSRVNVDVEFNIIGPVEDSAYATQCRTALERLGSNIRVNWLGPRGHAAIHDLMASHDLFFLPTLGENYGHVIAEALAAGTPVLISDTTPWRNLAAQGAGWDLPLADPRPFAKVIDDLGNQSASERTRLRQTTLAYAEAMLGGTDAVDANRRMFNAVIASGC